MRTGEAVGFTQENYREIRADDMQPILLPWNEKKEAVFWFEGSDLFGG